MIGQGEDRKRDEAAAQNELGQLLQRPRPDTVRQQVAAALQKDTPTADKIAEIRRIDAAIELEERGETVGQPLVRPLSALRAILKKPLVRASLLEYVMRHYGKARAFARRSHVADASLVPPKVRMNPEVHKGFREQLQPLASELTDSCDRALESGWQVLSRGDYNLIVLLRRLCFEIKRINFRVLDYRDRDLVGSLRTLETYFLLFYYRGDHIARAIKALQTALAPAERERLQLQVATLLGPGLALPCLYDFIIGLNVVKFRKVLGIESLVFTELGELVNTRDFACPPSVQIRIGEQVQSLQKQIGALHKQRNEADHLKRVLPLDASGNPDWSPIARLYDGAPSSEGSRFAIDRDNLMALTPRLLSSFDATFTPLLAGRLRLLDGAMVTLFPLEAFAGELQRLRQTAANLAKLGFKVHVLTRPRLITLKNTGKGAFAAEGDTLQQIDEAVRILMAIAARVEDVLDSPLRRPDQTASDSLLPLIMPQREFALPAKEQRVVSTDSLQAKPVYEALRFLIGVCYACGAYFLDRPILLTLERAGKIDEKLMQTKAELERLVESPAT